MKGVLVEPVVSAFICAVAAITLTAQQQTSADLPNGDRDNATIFKSQSDLVVLHVSVFDRHSDAVPNLPEDAFHVVEDDRPQSITFFGSGDVPVAVGLVIDNSSSMLTRRRMVVAGTAAFAQSSHQEDEAFTIIFNEYVKPGLPDGVLFTQNPTLLQSTVGRFPAGGMTALYDAVIAGLRHLETSTHQKRVLVVLSDGEDNASQRSSDEMLKQAEGSDALIYTVSTANLDPGVGNHRLLRRLARVSGGAVYAPRSENDVVAAFKEIAHNIRRGYSIGYVPTNAAHDGKYRRVKVMVRVPGRTNLTVSARDGYLAPFDAPTR